MTPADRLALLRERGARERALRRYRAREPRAAVRLCACGCGACLEPGYLSSYLPGHRSAPLEPRACLCGCGGLIAADSRNKYLPGHMHAPGDAPGSRPARRLCRCRCGAEIPDHYRSVYLPGHR